MKTLTELLPLIILFLYYVAFAVLHAAYIKIAADKMGGMRVVWRDAFRFALGLMAIILIFRSVLLELGVTISTAELIVFSLILHLSAGGWFIGKRALSQNGEQVGWKNGVLISALAYVFLVITMVIANMVNK